MAQIKQTIELFVKILRGNGVSKIKSEVFRQAKFDKDEASEPMWKLLFEVLYYLNFGTIDDITIKSCSIFSSEELCIYVKTEMKMKGFCAKAFHELPNDMSSGSRELLLAFGWLMCRSSLIARFMEHCSSCLDSDSVADVNIPNIDFHKSSPSNGMELCDKVSYLMWLNNKLRINLRNLHAVQRQKEALIQKVHSATQGVTTDTMARDHLTVLEVMMLKNPELLKKNLKLLEIDSQRLEALLSWQQHDVIFWKWMESVLDAKLADSGMIEEVSATITPRTESVNAKLNNKLQLNDSIGKYAAMIDQMEQDLFKKKGTTMEDLDALLESITEDLIEHRTKLSDLLQKPTEVGSVCNTRQMPQPVTTKSAPLVRTADGSTQAAAAAPVIARIKPLKRTGSTTSSVTSVSVAEKEILKMESELGNLQKLVGKLQSDISFKQKHYNEELSALSSDMESLYEYISRGPAVFKS